MGLIVENIPQGGSLITEVLTTASGIVSGTNPLHTATKICNDSGSTIPYEVSTAFDKSVYTILGMEEQLKTLTYPTMIRNEFDVYLREAEKLQAGLPVSAAFLEFDTYLGSLGVTNDVC